MGAHRRKNRGFTLIETLIVVGVVAVLVALSLPLFLNAIEQSHIALDEAYERAALDLASAMYARGEINRGDFLAFDVENALLDRYAFPDSYGRCSLHKGSILYVIVGNNGSIEFCWILADPSASPDGYNFNVNSVPHHEERYGTF